MADQSKAALQEAFRLIKAGRVAEAQQIILDVTRQNPYNADAWYLASLTVDDPARKIELLERGLTADPEHAASRTTLNRLRGAPSPAPAAPATPPGPPPAPKRTTSAQRAVRPASKGVNRRQMLLLAGVGVTLLVVLIAVGVVLVNNQQQAEEAARLEAENIDMPTLRPSPTLVPSATIGPSPTPTATATATPSPTAEPFGQTATQQAFIRVTNLADLHARGTAAALTNPPP